MGSGFAYDYDFDRVITLDQAIKLFRTLIGHSGHDPRMYPNWCKLYGEEDLMTKHILWINREEGYS